jgi:streptogramin lyase
MKRNRLSRLAHSAVSSPVNLLSNAFAGLGRAFLFVSLAVMGTAWSTPAARAQGISFAYAQTTLAGPGGAGLAVDNSGNVFASNYGGEEVYEIVAVNGSIPANPTIKTVGSGYRNPFGLAVDAKGDLFVTDTTATVVEEILAVNGSIPANPTINTLLSPSSPLYFYGPLGVAVDGKGNVFFVAIYLVYEIEAVDGSIPANPTIRTLGSGFDAPYGVAVDASGNVFVTDTNNDAVYEILAVDGSIPANPTINTLASNDNNLIAPLGVAVDASGNVFFTDTGSSVVYEILAVDGSIVVLGSNLNPGPVAVDQNGNVFVDNSMGSIAELQLGSVNFGSANVCPAGHTTPAPCSNTITLTYNVAAGTTIGGVNILTAGAKNLDFQAEASDTSTTLCSAQTYSSPTTCTVDVTFAPLARGPRNGTVQIVDDSGKILATTPIYGSSVQHANQTIDFPTIEPQTALTPLDHLYATASSGLPVRFASNTPAVCTISGIRADFLTAGSCDIIATQAGNAEYFAAITGQTFLVHHRHQVISFDPIAPQPVGTMLTLTATTDSGLPITYASTTPTVCSVSGSTASLLNTGTCTIQASQAGNATWFSHGPKTQSFTVE